MSEFRLIKSSHCVGESNYHLLFIPKYRKPIFEEECIKKEFFRLCAEIARDRGLVLVAVNAGTDHAHVFVSNCRRYSAPVLAQLFKGITSRMLRKHPIIGPLLQKYVWKEGTCGVVDIFIVA